MRKPRAVALFFLPTTAAKSAPQWEPQADIYRAPDGWVIKMDLAGVRPQDVDITMHGSQLTISGVRHDWIVEDGWSHHTLEIAYNRFQRVFALPCNLERAGISVECRAGMLLVRVTCKEETNHG